MDNHSPRHEERVRIGVLFVVSILATAMVIYCATTLYDEDVARNEYFHVECEQPLDANSVVGPAYGPAYMVKDDRVGMLAWKFCQDATPMLKWPNGKDGLKEKK